ncbi:ligand of Numb protein X 2 isoform X2 [Octopus sinensis]|uniref:Ligand of Numb protein X 2 isoform X2 n=1 Tax=Octopus sinensis TaxID=2607531 RepID=A0A6P7SXG9_9MOLL|nr:ligand of Numb protein X 2 isoform X2 [Octopus sinensis]
MDWIFQHKLSIVLNVEPSFVLLIRFTSVILQHTSVSVMGDNEASSILLSPCQLLDKLLVVCPNVDYCEDVLPRSELEAHLLHRCRGAVTKCIKASLGCVFQGPRSALQSHLWECPYKDQQAAKNPVIDGEVSTIEIQRTSPELGISIVGGSDTPLLCIVIQEIFPDGVVARDNRLLPGDQLLEVNGEDLSMATHYEAQQALNCYSSLCRLTVYREKAEDIRPVEKEEILKITLTKRRGKQLGIKLVGKRNGPGVYILNLISQSLAAIDGRLKPDDQVLEINGQDVSYGSQEEAAFYIQKSGDEVEFVVCRKSRPQTPDLIRSTGNEFSLKNTSSDSDTCKLTPCRKFLERELAIQKDPSESLGISVSGGVNSPQGDTPIYVTNIKLTGCLGRTKQVKKGDVLLSINSVSLLGLSHNEAVKQLKLNTESKTITLKVLDGPEVSQSTPGNFTPSWLYWLQLPRICQTVKTISLLRGPNGSLGFAIVGGRDSSLGNLPMFVKSVVQDTPAAKDGRLRCGDMLLSVNDQSLKHVTHSDAVTFLKNATGYVTLAVVSWPGTFV